MRLRFFHEKARKTRIFFKNFSYGPNAIIHKRVLTFGKRNKVVKTLSLVRRVTRKERHPMNLQPESSYRPLLIVGYADSAHAVQCGRFFRRIGWEVRLVASAAEARRLVLTCHPHAVVLDTELPDESGWLLCAKLTHEDPDRRVFLLAPDCHTVPTHHLPSVKAAG